jgi:ring-1,2-phenylacetyl-CoA epoxidase subunit PaaC
MSKILKQAPMSFPLFDYTLRLGDTCLILGQRLAEWTGHAPVLEEDLALGNLGLDLLGQARAFLTYAGEVEGKGRSEDDLAFLRDAPEFRNVSLVEQPNGDFGQTMARHLLFAGWYGLLLERLTRSKDQTIAAVAEKSVKEIAYHWRHAAEWTIRLGDGTEESHRRMQAGLNQVWGYTPELFRMDATDAAMLTAGVGVDLAALQPLWDARIDAVLAEATLQRPTSVTRSNGKQGVHSEYLGHILTELQFMQRAYPGMQW